jgi:hypothetical protein
MSMTNADAFLALFDHGDRVGRRYASEARGAQLRVFEGQTNFAIPLPTVIRGRRVASLSDFVELEVEQPIQASEVPSGEPSSVG